MRSSPGQQRGEERAPRWATTQPRQVRAARSVLCERSADFPRAEERTRRVPRDSNAIFRVSWEVCRRPVAVLVRSSPGRRLGEKRALRWPTTQPRQVHAARRVLRGRSADFPRGEERARRASRDLNAVTGTCRRPCRRPVAVLVWSRPGQRRGWSASRVDREDNHAKSASVQVLRGRSADFPRGEKRTRRAPWDSNAVKINSREPFCRPVAVFMRSSPGRQREVERAPR